MEKKYNPQETEEKIYAMWEKQGYFTPEIVPSKQPFSVLLPPPNANDPLHIGHALYVVEDILCRWNRMKGNPTLFLPGTDHAGIETQYVFEKKLTEQGKSRFDFDRETLYKMIDEFVEQNKGVAKAQMKRLGFGLDWTREKYTLDPQVLEIVFETFRKLHNDGLIYRDEKLVNYCTHCGTAFSDLEVVYQERKTPLYYMKYGPFVIATVRPETKFGDTAVAVNPKDKRYQKWIGKHFIYDSLIGPRTMKVIADELIDPDFGTGVVKVTPAHDWQDFEIAKKHKLKILRVINQDGKLNEVAGRFSGLTVFQARKEVVEELKKRGDLVKIDENYCHRVGICYRCKTIIEPMLMPQWFIKIDSLAKPAIEVVKKGQLKIIPPRFKKLYLQWMENIRDWNISRQIVWGPRIPAWYCLDCCPEITISFVAQAGQKISGAWKDLKTQYSFSEIKKGLQALTAPKEARYGLQEKPCFQCASANILQETDTFDTWFSSGQWPLTTLGFPEGPDFKYFYPFSVLDTMWDILFFWVARMIMLGIYRSGKVPFLVAHMHCRVVDKKGQKMSKSRGNVINPIEMIENYGADALRMALVFGVAPGSDICLSDDKIRAMRNFATKIWNAARFVLSQTEQNGNYKLQTINYKPALQTKADKEILKSLNETIKAITKDIDTFQLHEATQKIYQFFWHDFCDVYIEESKKQIEEGTDEQKQNTQNILLYVLRESLKLLHPFMPFITEQIYQMLPNKEKPALIIETWPE